MGIDEFLTLVKNRRSIRQFKADPVPDDCLEKILEAARWTMSGGNAQPWELIVVRDQATKNRIGEICLEARKRTQKIETTRVEELRHGDFTTPPTALPGFVHAPVLILVCGDPRTFMTTVLITQLYAAEGGPRGTYISNLANATHMLQLAAFASGLAAHWVSVDQTWEGKLRTLLEVPDELEIHTIVPIGYPAYEPPGPYRRELKEFVHYGKYDHSKFRTEDDIIEYVRQLRQKMKPVYAAFNR